jgi:hypothetical protein
MAAFRKSRDPTSPVSFRLSANLKKVLAERGTELGLSPGEFARKLVAESLTNDFQTKVIDELARILRTTQAARNDIETAALGLLITAGNQPAEVAEEWLKANMRTEV